MGALDGEVQVPALGGVSKKVLVSIGVAAGGFVAWKFWQARGSGSDGDASPIADGEFGAVDSSIPGVIGAVKPGNAYGDGDAEPAGDAGQSVPKTNAAWSDLALTKLQNGDRWGYSDMAAALGNYLEGRPLSSEQQEIVRAAIAVAGYPPVGSHSIISGGNTAITVAPTGLKATVTGTTVTVTCAPVAGATRYRLGRSTAGLVGDSTTPTVTAKGLSPNTLYSFTMAAVSASGQIGPSSSPLSVRTATVTLGQPATPRVTIPGRTTTRVETKPLANAEAYRWYLNGKFYAESPSYGFTFTGLRPNTSYRAMVQGDTHSQAAGRPSAQLTFKTQK